MSILFIVMKPFSFDYHNACFRRVAFGLLWTVLIFVSGCGGFDGGDSVNTEGSSGINLPVVFF